MLYTYASVLMRSAVQSLQNAYRRHEELPALLEEGIYLSSPDLWNEYQKKNSMSGKEIEKLNLSIAKYNIRSSTRCTPYGTFAGTAMVDITDDETDVVLDHEDSHIRRIRVDMNYITEIIYALLQMPVIREQMKFYPNNSVYELSDSFRYVQYSISNNYRNYELISIEKNNYLSAILEVAKTGANFKTLTDLLIASEDVSEEEASEFVISLYNSQLLVADLEPTVTGSEPLANLIEKVNALENAEELSVKLKKVQDLIYSSLPGVHNYKEIENSLRDLPINIKIPKNTLQTDLFLSTKKKTLNKKVVQGIVRQAEELFVLSRAYKNKHLEDFKKKFVAKYEQEEVPLAIVLDVELGIGYAGTDQQSTGEDGLISNLFLSGQAQVQSQALDPIQQFISLKYHDYLDSQKELIEITVDEIKKVERTLAKFEIPDSLHLFCSIFKKGTDFDEINYMVDVHGFTGPSAGKLLARFTHGDATLYALTKEIMKQEEMQNPGAIYAEIAHFPQSRLGNVLLRPVLRDYEIPFVGKSGIDVERQIPINDILVSIREDKIYLRSEKYNKQVLPRITNAHNYVYKTLPLYRFLGDLQNQNSWQPVLWEWGALSSQPRLPRVVYKNLILSKAIWRIEEDKINDLPHDKKDYIQYFRSFRERWKLPQQVLYIENDNKLLIDFEEPVGIELFLHYLRRTKFVVVEEFLFTEENCIIKNEKGESFTNEFVIPLYRNGGNRDQSINHLKTKISIKRKFTPSSEWLYFKIYTGPTVAEKLLKNEILKFVEKGLEKALFEKFFFLRFRDESAHLRIRFYNSDTSKQASLQALFMQFLSPLVDDQTIDKITIETYTREIERYTATFIEASESLFFYDSFCVIKFLSLLDGPEYANYRMIFALRGIDLLLSDFGYSLSDKKSFTKELQEQFFKEFGGKNALEKQLNDKYRSSQKEIFSHLNEDFDIANDIEEAVAIFKKRSENIHPIATHILEATVGNNQVVSELLKSYIHLFMNRMFINNQRKYELVIYHFLERYYQSRVAIEAKTAEKVRLLKFEN